jgi:tetratricopeptide (TPR) repeat protein
MRCIFLVCLAIVITASTGFAQKVKYKDLFVLLRVENYDDADKFLRIYLQQEPDDPHANYSMGRMLQAYLDEGDLLNGSARLQELADSSIYFYGRAMELTTEKFVKKHDDDYYLDFRRRDMRTGKFIVNYDHVKLDIEERVAMVNKYSSDLENLLAHFKKAQDFYSQCREMYIGLTEQSSNLNKLYFTSTTDDVDVIRNMVHLYDSSLYHLNTYSSIMKEMGKSAVNQKFNEKDIDSYPDGGKPEIDFYRETIEYLNYKSWANTTIDIILKQIFPLKKRLITFDKRVKELHDEVVRDSLDKRDEVFRLATENVGRDLRDYDPNSLPAAIFNYRIAEINYHSAVYYWLREIADTVDLGVKYDMLYDFKSQISGISKLVQKMHATHTPEQVELYNEYINARYESPEGMTNFIIEHEEEVREDSLMLVQWLAELKELDKIAIWHNDSIALTAGDSKGSIDRMFTTIIVDTLATRTLGFYAWDRQKDSLTLTFGVAPSSRQVDSLFQVPINTAVYDPTLPIPEFIVDTVGLGQRIWLLQSAEMAEDSTYATQLIVTDYTLGPSWSRDMKVKDHVTQIRKDVETDNLLILGEGEKALAVINKYGEPVVEEEVKEPENEDEEKGDEGEDQGNSEEEKKEGGGH